MNPLQTQQMIECTTKQASGQSITEEKKQRIKSLLTEIPIDDMFDLLYGKEITGEWESLPPLIESRLANGEKEANSILSSVAYGATKAVLFLKEFDDIVIKIPYKGWEYFVYDDEVDTGLSSIGFVDFEQTGGLAGGYCEVEEELYEAAVGARVQDFFAKTEYAFTLYDCIPVYVSERCDIKDWDTPPLGRRQSWLSDFSEFSSRMAHHGVCTAISWNLYKTDDTPHHRRSWALVTFLEANDIFDLHDNNWGVSKDGKLKIIDYSGFDEEMEERSGEACLS
jgi:hypothetical protein